MRRLTVLLAAVTIAACRSSTDPITVASVAGTYDLADSVGGSGRTIPASGGHITLVTDQTYVLEMPAGVVPQHSTGTWQIEPDPAHPHFLLLFPDPDHQLAWTGTLGKRFGASKNDEDLVLVGAGTAGNTGPYGFNRR